MTRGIIYITTEESRRATKTIPKDTIGRVSEYNKLDNIGLEDRTITRGGSQIAKNMKSTAKMTFQRSVVEGT